MANVTTRSNYRATNAASPTPVPRNDSQSPATTPPVREKAHIAVNDIFPGLIIGSIFTWMSLLDLGICTFAVKSNNPMFAVTWYDYKASDRVVSTIILVLSLTLPVAIVQVSLAFFKTFTHKAPRMVHLFDIINFIALGSVVYTLISHTIPTETAIKSLAADYALASSQGRDTTAITSKIVSALESLRLPHIELFASNVVMLFLPLFRLKEANIAAAQVQINALTKKTN